MNEEDDMEDITLASGGYFSASLLKPYIQGLNPSATFNYRSQQNTQLRSSQHSANFNVSLGEQGRNKRSLFSPLGRVKGAKDHSVKHFNSGNPAKTSRDPVA